MIRREELLKEELDRLSGIGDIMSESPSTLKLIDANTLVIVSSEQFRGPTPNQVVKEYEITEFDHVLVVLEDIILDIAPTPILVYTDDYSTDEPHSVATYIEDILDGRQSASELDTENEDHLRQLQEAGLLSYQTPSAAAELLTNWTTLEGRQTILNAGCGTGQLLVTTRNQLKDDDEDTPDYSLWGIDTSRIAAEISQNRLGEDATQEEIDRRTGFNTYCFCIHCETQVDLDLDRDEKACPECRSNAVKTIDELVDEQCPVCEAGTVIAEDTGAIA